MPAIAVKSYDAKIDSKKVDIDFVSIANKMASEINGETITDYNNGGFITFQVYTAFDRYPFSDYVLKLNYQ